MTSRPPLSATLDHIALLTPNLDATLSFYTDTIGLAGHRVSEYRDGTVPFPSIRLNATTIIDLFPTADAPAAAPPPTPPLSGPPLNNHFCVCVDDAAWAPLLARLDAARVPLEMGPTKMSWARGTGEGVYVRDPAGHLVEFRHYG